jgi:hypothetical protein
MHVKKKQKLNISKLRSTFTSVPLSPDDLSVPSRLFLAIFLDADNFFKKKWSSSRDIT